METTTLELPTEMRIALDEIAERSGRSRSALIHEAIHSFLRQQAQRSEDPDWPRSIGMGATDVPQAADIDDWLAANWRPEDDWGRS